MTWWDLYIVRYRTSSSISIILKLHNTSWTLPASHPTWVARLVAWTIRDGTGTLRVRSLGSGDQLPTHLLPQLILAATSPRRLRVARKNHWSISQPIKNWLHCQEEFNGFIQGKGVWQPWMLHQAGISWQFVHQFWGELPILWRTWFAEGCSRTLPEPSPNHQVAGNSKPRHSFPACKPRQT